MTLDLEHNNVAIVSSLTNSIHITTLSWQGLVLKPDIDLYSRLHITLLMVGISILYCWVCVKFLSPRQSHYDWPSKSMLHHLDPWCMFGVCKTDGIVCWCIMKISSSYLVISGPTSWIVVIVAHHYLWNKRSILKHFPAKLSNSNLRWTIITNKTCKCSNLSLLWHYLRDIWNIVSFVAWACAIGQVHTLTGFLSYKYCWPFVLVQPFQQVEPKIGVLM